MCLKKIVLFLDIFKFINLACFFTLGNAALGVLAVLFCFLSLIAQTPLAHFAGYLILLAMVFDFLDGKIARLMKQTSKFGKELDSLADVISFGIAPAVLGFSMGLNSGIAIIVLVFYVLCSLLRLARYNVTNKNYFEGMPVPVAAFVIVILSFFVPFANIFILLIYIILGILMISSIPIPVKMII